MPGDKLNVYSKTTGGRLEWDFLWVESPGVKIYTGSSGHHTVSMNYVPTGNA